MSMPSQLIALILFSSFLLNTQAQILPPPSLIINLFRHGSRGPNDDLWDPTWNQSQVSELTAVGMRSHYILGKILRSEYEQRYGPNFLVSEYTADKVFVRSTDVNRTIMSAYAQLYGLFEGKGEPHKPLFDKNLTWPPYNSPNVEKIAKTLTGGPALPLNFLPFPDHMVSYGEDYVLSSRGSCSNFRKWRDANEESQDYKQMIARFQKTIDKLKDMGYDLHNWFLLNDFADTVIVNHRENKTQPGKLPWESEIIQDIVFLYNWGSVFTQFAQPIQRQVMSTPILNHILDLAKASTNGTSNLQLALLSGHDDTLLAFLAPLGIVTAECIYENFLNKEKIPHPDCEYPIFTANIRIEVYNQSKPLFPNPFLRFFYNGKEIRPCKGISLYCSLKDYEELVKKVTNNNKPDQFPKLCGNSKTNSIELKEMKIINWTADKQTYLRWGLGLITIVLLVLNVFQIVRCIRLRNKQETLLPPFQAITEN